MPKKLLFIFLLSASTWVILLLSRVAGLIEFDRISFITFASLIFFLISISAGFFLSNFLVSPRSGSGVPSYKKHDVCKFAHILLFLELFCVIFTLYKLIFVNGDFSVGLNDITRSRLERGRVGGEIGGSFVGVLAYSLSGFYVLGYAYARCYSAYLPSALKYAFTLFLFLGAFLDLMNGGRFGLIITCLVLVYIHVITNKVYLDSRFISYLFKFLLVFPVLYFLFHKIFIYRFIGAEYDAHYAIAVLNERLVSARPSFFLEYLVANSVFSELIFGLSLFFYYIGHSVSQLDALLNMDPHVQWPYYFQYQFYPFVSLLSKIGIEGVPISEIILTLPISGAYITSIGAGYLDLGYFFMFIFYMGIGLFGGGVGKFAVRTGNFTSTCMAALFFVYLTLSPFVSVIGTANFPAIMAASFFIFLFGPKIRMFNAEGR